MKTPLEVDLALFPGDLPGMPHILPRLLEGETVLVGSDRPGGGAWRFIDSIASDEGYGLYNWTLSPDYREWKTRIDSMQEHRDDIVQEIGRLRALRDQYGKLPDYRWKAPADSIQSIEKHQNEGTLRGLIINFGGAWLYPVKNGRYAGNVCINSMNDIPSDATHLCYFAK